VDAEGDAWFRGIWYLRPSETHHSPTRTFYVHELLAMPPSAAETNSMQSIISRCHVYNLAEFQTVRRIDLSDDDIYVCDAKYDDRKKEINRCKAGGVSEIVLPSTVPVLETATFAEPLVLTRVPSPFAVPKPAAEAKKPAAGDAPTQDVSHALHFLLCFFCWFLF
jgi:hypothetical protein